ncbi:hypothetical protein [Leifsonia sp. Leaf264]|uniref:hypothetical protein n=1 Tax=Leifsonia sp. Leaf264 TaxID=1736314 RepID=UPI000A6F807E|nr:hypothetical protein [Leifsonia sp. Leaf264]
MRRGSRRDASDGAHPDPTTPSPSPKEETAAPAGAQFERWTGFIGNVVAPATLIGALLFYFGYVSSRAQFDYFGVDVDVIGLSTQDYVMRSPQPLLVPVLVLTLLGAGLIALHAGLRRRLASPRLRSGIRGAIIVGLIVLAVGLVLVFLYPVIGAWAYYPLVAPLVLAVGAALTAYGLGTLRVMERDAATASGAPPPRLGVIVLLWATVAAALFWATATVAQWSGLGLAQAQARHLDELPSVIVDTQQRLYLPEQTGVHEVALPGAEDDRFRYRYWGLRLLIVGDDRMFLVPDTWSNRDTTLVVPLDGSTRVQFQFRNDAPE